MMQANIDTDQIVPKQFLTTTGRTGLAQALFHDHRFDLDGRAKPEFVLNRPEYAGAGILIAGANFGCGSSREHAVWALLQSGIRCVVAPSFADIFAQNCYANGLLPLVAPEPEVLALAHEANGGTFTIDLPMQRVLAPSQRTTSFAIDPTRKRKLVDGLDDIDLTLLRERAIEAFEQRG